MFFARNRVKLGILKRWLEQEDNWEQVQNNSERNPLIIYAEAQEQLLVDVYVDSSSRCRA